MCPTDQMYMGEVRSGIHGLMDAENRIEEPPDLAVWGAYLGL